MFLLDVNLLIALGDPFHTHHSVAVGWFAGQRHLGWATCPLTENGFVRVLGHPNYPKSPGTSTEARRLLGLLCALPGHQFWSDDITLTDSTKFPVLPGSKGLTDVYLLALALQHRARLATLDQRLDPALIRRGSAALLLVKGKS